MDYNYLIRDELISDEDSRRHQLFIFDYRQKSLKGFIYKNDDQKERILQNYKDYKFIHNIPIQNSFSAPFKIFIDITSKCNLNCRHCLNKGNIYGSTDINMDAIHKIKDYCLDHGVFFIKLGGGEPLLRPDIVEIIQELHKSNALISLTTNGTVCRNDIFKCIYDNRVKISVSLDGDRNSHNFIRGDNTSYDRTVKCLDGLAIAGVKPVIKYTINNYNCSFESISHVITLARDRGLTVHLRFTRPIGRCSDSISNIKADSVKNIILKYSDCENVKIDEEYKEYDNPELMSLICSGKRCGAAIRSMHIASDGIIRPCIFIDPSNYSDLKSIQNSEISDIWENDINFIKIRNLSVPEQCKNCSNYCKSVCYAYRYNYSGEILGDNPICVKMWNGDAVC